MPKSKANRQQRSAVDPKKVAAPAPAPAATPASTTVGGSELPPPVAPPAPTSAPPQDPPTPTPAPPAAAPVKSAPVAAKGDASPATSHAQLKKLGIEVLSEIKRADGLVSRVLQDAKRVWKERFHAEK